jgi:hypothetical protein
MGNNHLLEIRLLKTGFLSRFQPYPYIRSLVFDIYQKKKILERKQKFLNRNISVRLG